MMYVFLLILSVNVLASDSPVMKALAKAEAKSFYERLKRDIQSAQEKGIDELIKNSPQLTPDEKETFKSLIDKSSVKRPNLYEVSPGVWKAKFKRYTVSLSIDEVYRGKLRINEQIFNFEDVSALELETELLQHALKLQRTSWWRLFEQLIGINNSWAQDALPVYEVVAPVLLAMNAYAAHKRSPNQLQNYTEAKKLMDENLSSCEMGKAPEFEIDSFEQSLVLSEERCDVTVRPATQFGGARFDLCESFKKFSDCMDKVKTVPQASRAIEQ